MKSNNTILRELMEKHNLTRPRVAALLKTDVSTVDRWLTPATRKRKPNPTHRKMSDSRLDHFRRCLQEELGHKMMRKASGQN